MIFSLTLSKIIIVSFTEYHNTVKIAITNILSTTTNGLKCIQIPYQPAAIVTSCTKVRTVTNENIQGAKYSLTHTNAIRT
jgi:hypothetical protein